MVTDKVNMEFPSPASGVLTRILAQEGDVVPMGTAIAEMAADGEDSTATPASYGAAERIDTLGTYIEDASPVGPTGSANVPLREHAPPAPPERRRQRHSPAVRRLAEQHGIDLAGVTGTGMGGRVTMQDVRRIVEEGAPMGAASSGLRPEVERDGEQRNMWQSRPSAA